MAEQDQLNEIRDRIDRIDRQLHELLNERAKAAHEVAEVKRAHDPDAFFYRPEREAQILRQVQQLNQGPLHDEEVARLFREIMSACLAQQEPLKVAYLGPEGTFTQQAVHRHFGHSVHAISLPGIDGVFEQVQAGDADFGVVPVENSSQGIVSHTLDMFLLSDLKICGEIELRVHQNLLTLAKNLDQIERVYSHEQSLSQCKGWLDRKSVV